MIEKGMVIGIDGLSATGKSTAAYKIIKKYSNVIHLEMSDLYKLLGEWYFLLQKQKFTNQEILDFIDKYIKVEYKVVKQEVVFNLNLPRPVHTESAFFIKNQTKKIMQNQDVRNKTYKVIKRIIDELKKDNAIILTGRELYKVYPKLDYHFCLKLDDEERIKRLMNREGITEQETKSRNLEKKIYDFSDDVITINSERMSPKEILKLIENVITTCNKNDKIIKVHFMGTTSSGKTTMCRYCAEKYNEPYSVELIRKYVEEKGITASELSTITYETFYELAEQQLLSEKKREKLSKKYFFADSGAIAMALDCNFMDRPDMIELVDRQLKEAEVIFLCDNNIDFVDDGIRRGANSSQILHDKMLNYLNQKNIPYIILSGSIEERFKTIQQVLKKIR